MEIGYSKTDIKHSTIVRRSSSESKITYSLHNFDLYIVRTIRIKELICYNLKPTKMLFFMSLCHIKGSSKINLISDYIYIYIPATI